MGKPVKKKDKPQSDDKQTKISSFFGNQHDKKEESKLFTKFGNVPLQGARRLTLAKCKTSEIVSSTNCTSTVATADQLQGQGSRKEQTLNTKNTSQVDDNDVIIVDDGEPTPKLDFKLNNTLNVNDLPESGAKLAVYCGNLSTSGVNKGVENRQPVADKNNTVNPRGSNDHSQNCHTGECSTIDNEVYTTGFTNSKSQNKNHETNEICEAAEAAFVTPKKQGLKDNHCDSLESSPDIICDTPNVDSIFKAAAARRRKTVSNRSFLCPSNLLGIQPGLKPAHLRLNQQKGARKLLGKVSVSFTSYSDSLSLPSEDKITLESSASVINADRMHADTSNCDNDFSIHDNICTESHNIKQVNSNSLKSFKERLKRSKTTGDMAEDKEQFEMPKNDKLCIPETQLFDNATDFKTTDSLEEDIEIDDVISDGEKSPQMIEKTELLSKFGEKLWSQRHKDSIEQYLKETEEACFENSTVKALSRTHSESHTSLLVQKVSSYDTTATDNSVKNIFVTKPGCGSVKSRATESTKSSSKLINALEEVDSRAEMTEESLWVEQRLMKHFSEDSFTIHSEKNTEESTLQDPSTTPVKIYGRSKCVVKRQAKPGLSPFSKRQPSKAFTELKDKVQTGHSKDKEPEKLASSILKAKKILCLENHAPPPPHEIPQNKCRLSRESRAYQFDLKKKGVIESNDKQVTLENDKLLCELLGKLKSPSKAEGKAAAAQVLKELNPAPRATVAIIETEKGPINKFSKENFVRSKTAQRINNRGIVKQSDIEMLDQLFGKDTSDSEDVEMISEKETTVNNQVSLLKLDVNNTPINNDIHSNNNSRQETSIIVLDDTLNMSQKNDDCIIIEDNSIDMVTRETCNEEPLLENLCFPSEGRACNPIVLENLNCFSIPEDNSVTLQTQTDQPTNIPLPQAVPTHDAYLTSSELSACASKQQSFTSPAEYTKIKGAALVDIEQVADSCEDPSEKTTLTLAMPTTSVIPNSFTGNCEQVIHGNSEMLTVTTSYSSSVANIPPIVVYNVSGNDSCNIAGNDSCNIAGNDSCNIDNGNVNSIARTVNNNNVNSTEDSYAVKHSVGHDNEIRSPTTFAGAVQDTELSTSAYDMLCESFGEDFLDSEEPEMPKKDFRFTDLWNRFTVQEVAHNRDETNLRLLCEKSRKFCQCILRGFWTDTIVSKEDVVNIVGDFNDDLCIIDDRNGLIIVNPDKLLSGTSVVNSTFCARKSVLNEKFKGVDIGNLQMFYGSVIHSLFQTVLKDCVRDESAIMRIAKLLLKTNKFLHDMYNLNIQETTVMEEIGQYCPSLSSWLTKHTEISRKEGKGRLQESDMIVTEIHDIEENIWSPRFGLKGKIDVTVKAKLRKPNRLPEVKILPLELKTGKASFSHEHKGQVTLYSMMCSDRREDPGEGILLYLKHGEMESVPVVPQNKRGLIQLRNHLAHYLTQEVRQEKAADGQTTYRLGQLPQPIDNHRACSKCAQLLNCSIYQRRVEHRVNSESQSMNTLVQDTLQHLTEADLGYFTHWMLCLDMEGQVSQNMHLSQIWRSSSAEREKNGDCISNLVIASSDLDIPESQCFNEGRGCSITFNRDPSFQGSALTAVGLVDNDMVVISSEDGQYIALATGFVRRISQNLVEVVVDRDYLHDTRAYSNMRFRLDKNDSFSTASYLCTNLSRLMESTPRATHLRNLIITLKPPEFDLKLSKACIQKVKPILKPLNKPQRTAILKILMSKDYVLIKGFPGTGKTATIVALVKILRLIGLSVLLTSYTHSAVDNILLKLKEDGIPFLRLGRRGRIHPSILPHSAEVMTCSAAVNSVQELKRFYDSYDIVATSALGVNHPIFNQRRFDVCIVDEASQVLQPACLGPLFHCHKFVLVGDPKQLPPVVQSREARNIGMDESLFARLDNSGATYDLCLQYRMNRVIMALSNSLVYEGKLQCGSEAVAEQCCKLNHAHILDTPSWVKDALSLDLERSVVFLDTQRVFSVEVSSGKGLINETEANLVMTLLKALVKAGVAAHDLGVISPYRSQVKLIKQKVIACSDVIDAEVNTVDQYQGRDKSIIIVSFVRTQSDNTGELLKDLRRLNVALTRARHKLILIGNGKSLTAYGHIADILMQLEKTNSKIIQIPEL